MNTFINIKRVRTLLKVLTLFFCVGWYLINFLTSNVPADAGDGIMHFYISNASWEHPNLFLDHWGKPLFILLSSPFSQFGFTGMILFNILVFILTIFVSWKIASKLSIPFVLQLLFPILLINIQDYSLTVLGGLTEPLFNLFFLFSFWMLLSKRWMILAILVSFMPFLRSEGQLPILLIFALLIYLKEYQSIPFLLTGMIIYSIIGYFVFNDFLWYFTHNPYHMNNSIYSQGSWNHYLFSYKNYLSNPGLFLFLISSIILFYEFIKKKLSTLDFMLIFYVFGTYFTILFLHSYFWATGQNGSLGLTRIATQAMPSFVLLNLYFFSKLSIFSIKSVQFSFYTLILLLIFSSIRTKHFPVQASSLEKNILHASVFMKDKQNNSVSFFYHHPLFCFSMGDNPYKNNQTCKFYYSVDLNKELKSLIKHGDYLIWDSQFGPREQGLSLSKLNKTNDLELIKQFGFDESNSVRIYYKR